MTDRELLELAAKAAGIPVRWDDEAEVTLFRHAIGTVPWNPLTDDGDAFRLAVKLGLLVHCATKESNFASATLGRVVIQSVLTGEHGTPEEKTRRAIVRAAAEIGKALP